MQIKWLCASFLTQDRCQDVPMFLHVELVGTSPAMVSRPSCWASHVHKVLFRRSLCACLNHRGLRCARARRSSTERHGGAAWYSTDREEHSHRIEVLVGVVTRGAHVVRM